MQKLIEEARKFMLKKKERCAMLASDYQGLAKETAIFPKEKALEYLSLGLVGEAGEIANKVKKVIRDRKGIINKQTELADNVADEIGDVLWYCAMLSDYIGADLGEIMNKNLNKLDSRKKRGTLGGSGDNR